MTDRICIHCKQPAKRGARMTKDGYLHNGCWDMYFASREGPLDDRSMAAKEVDEGRSELKKPELFTSTTDSGTEDSNEPNQQSEKTRKGKSFLGILVILIAVGGATLIFMSGQDSSVPQIEGYGGNQNPFVGITNVGIGVIGIFETVMYLIAGGILLVIALVVYRIRRRSSRPPVTVGSIGDSDRSGYRWTAFYQGYLLLAVLFALIALRWGLTVTAIAKVALFALAFYSLRIPNKTWTRNFHIAINGVATIMPLVLFAAMYGHFLSINPVNSVLWLPVPNFYMILPFSSVVVMLLTAGLAATWCYFFVRHEHYR